MRDIVEYCQVSLLARNAKKWMGFSLTVTKASVVNATIVKLNAWKHSDEIGILAEKIGKQYFVRRDKRRQLFRLFQRQILPETRLLCDRSIDVKSR